MTVEQMQAYIGVDSLRFVSIDGLYRALGIPEGRDNKAPAYYDAVFTGDYPIEPKDMLEQGFELKAAE